MMKLVLLTFACLVLAVASAEKQPFERYQPIVDRQMFGPLPPGFDSTKLPSEVQKSSASGKELTQEQEKLKSAVRFSVVNVTSDGQTEVGFTDSSNPKAPKHYFMKEGEIKDGWTVKKADAEKATMTIAKDEIEVTLTLGGNSATDAAATARAGGEATPAANPAVRSPLGQRGGLMGVGSIRARRLLRQQEAAAAQAQADAAAAEKEAARQAQAEAEKAQREQERAEQRQQLLAIQEELKKVREAKVAEAAKANEGEGAQDEAQ